MKYRPIMRLTDNWGSGWYGAPRGFYKHHGEDIPAYKGLDVVSITDGKCTKIGFPYSQNDLEKVGRSLKWQRRFDLKKELRYVQVTCSETGYNFRYFYVDPEVKKGDDIYTGQVIGKVHGLCEIYPGITDHIHFEVKNGSQYIDPNKFL